MRERKEVMHLSKREEYEARAEKLFKPILKKIILNWLMLST